MRSALEALTIGLLLLYSLAGCSSQRSASSSAAGAGDSFVGAWRSRIHFNQGALAPIQDLEFLYAFNAGGTMTESSNYDGAPPVPPAYGIWRAVGQNQIEAVYTYYNTRPPATFDDVMRGGGWLPAGRGVLTERFTLGGDGQSFESAISLELHDQAGKRVEGGGTGTGQGTRIRF